MTEYEKMLAGKIYDPNEEEVMRRRVRAHELCKLYNDTLETETDKRKEILAELLPSAIDACIQGPIFFDYGVNTTFGKGCYVNFNFTVLDVCPVTIGDNVFIGPNVSILPPKHPLLAEERKMYFDKNKGYVTDKEYGAPVSIGNDCWIAGNVTVLAGARIGSGCVVGAGSVVTKDIPDGYLAYGNPCRPISKITEKDSVESKPELW